MKSKTKVKVNKLRLACDEYMCLEIFHVFIKDLLGGDTSASRMFEIKSEEDFSQTKMVTMRAKYLAIICIIVINVFFVYYSVLRGYVKGIVWQRAFPTGCIIQFMAEVLINDTVECMWLNIFIPSLVSAELQA